MSDHPPEANTTPSIPSRLSEAVNGMDWEKADRLAAVDEEERVAATQVLRADELEKATKRLWEERGVRYEYCQLDNFVASTKVQENVRSRLRDFAVDLAIQPSCLSGLVLIGPPGTGKDHLMAALMRCALTAKLLVKWTSGLGLFRRLRDAIDGNTSEGELLRAYTKPDILAISDPCWEREPLSRWERQRLGEIVDDRWNNCRPIWMTINVEGPADAEKMLGSALVDRLVDGALSLACNWESYRHSLGGVELTGPDQRKPTLT